MPLARPTPLAPLALGLLVLALGAACLTYVASFTSSLALGTARSDAKPLTLQQLFAHEGGVLMSCAHEPSTSNEPLWCANPDAPYCAPGVPAPRSEEPWAGPIAALAACEEEPAGSLFGKLVRWPNPTAATRCSFGLQRRLDRPPRRS